jgi:hypothetical protein
MAELTNLESQPAEPGHREVLDTVRSPPLAACVSIGSLLAGTLLAGSLLTACAGGGQPRLARSDAAPLIALSNRIAAEGACAQARDIRALQARAIRLVNAKRVPGELQERFLGGVNLLASRVPACVPTAPPAAASGGTTSAAPGTGSPGRRSPGEQKHGEGGKPHGNGHGHGHGHGHGKG